MTTGEMLKSLGAKRPMAPAGDHVLVLGEWFEGYYPIKWKEGRGAKFDQWSIFGIRCPPLTRDECERILKAHSRDS